MSRCLERTSILFVIFFIFFSLRFTTFAQTENTQSKSWTIPRTPWGDPDLQGLWNNSTTTALEKPQAFEDKQFLSEAELTELEQLAQDRADQPPRPGDTGSYNAFWFDRGNLLSRTSLIIDPPNGKLPPRTAAGELRASWQRGSDSWRDRTLAERCITRGAPKRPGGYNNNFLIMQTPNLVIILQEMIHEVRFIFLDGRTHIPERIRQWTGSSRGRWENDTLVVETNNFKDDIVFNSYNCCPGSGSGLHLTEHFTLIDENTIDHQYTVTDPTTYTHPWTAAIPMRRFEGPIYEYACHEGNIGLEGSLSGARSQEK